VISISSDYPTLFYIAAFWAYQKGGFAGQHHSRPTILIVAQQRTAALGAVAPEGDDLTFFVFPFPDDIVQGDRAKLSILFTFAKDRNYQNYKKHRHKNAKP
jgi:hypothetical protein